MAEFISDYGLYTAYILTIIALIAAIVLPLISAASDPKSLVGSLGGLAAVAIIFFIGWSLASNEVTPEYTEFGVDSSASKIIGGALITFYIMTGIAILGIIFSEIAKIFR